MTENPEDVLLVESHGAVRLLTLNRPDALNAFNLTMARELEQVFLTDARHDDVRAVVVTGSGRAHQRITAPSPS